MRTLDRYVIRNFLASALLWLLVLLAIRIVADLFVNLDEFAEGDSGLGGTATAILSYYGYQSLVYFAELGGIIIVAAATFTLAMMNHTNELTAMMASGVSLHRVVWPVVVCSILMGAAIVVDQELLIPRVPDKLVRSQDDALGAKPFALRLVTDGSGTVWYSPKFDPASGCMNLPQLIVRDAKYRQLAGISGQQGRPGKLDDRSGWLIESASLVRPSAAGQLWMQRPNCQQIYTNLSPQRLRQGGLSPAKGEDDYYELTVTAGQMQRDQGQWKLSDARFTFHAADRERGMAVGLCTFVAPTARWMVDSEDQGYWQLQDAVLFYPSDLTCSDLVLRQSGQWMQYMSSSQLGKLLRMQRTSDVQQARLIRHTRLTDPLSNLVMLLLALPFILSRERNIKSSASMCVGMVGTYYAFVYLCRYIVPMPALAAWLPILVFAPIAALMLDSVKT